MEAHSQVDAARSVLMSGLVQVMSGRCRVFLADLTLLCLSKDWT